MPHTTHTSSHSFIFFGTPDRAVWTLERLKELGYIPRAVVTQPDRPQGRKLIITPPPAKLWAEQNGIPVLQPESVNSETFIAELNSYAPEFFVVVAYGKILPEKVLAIPQFGALNLHGSLLPKLRGASPIETAILEDVRETGPTIILMDSQMDHGPVIAQEKIEIPDSAWPPFADELAQKIVTRGAELIAESMPTLSQGTLIPQEQNHAAATYTKKITKEDGLIDLADDAHLNYRKYKAYKGWPGVYFFKDEDGTKIRMKITEAEYRDGVFIVTKVIPEGKKEMAYRP